MGIKSDNVKHLKHKQMAYFMGSVGSNVVQQHNIYNLTKPVAELPTMKRRKEQRVHANTDIQNNI